MDRDEIVGITPLPTRHPIALPTSDAPEVSIIIPTRQRPALLGGCLAALAHQIGAPIAAEVLIVLNDADDEMRAFVAEDVEGAVVIRSDVNLGFAGGNNVAAAQARGRYLVLLNDDAEPERGWLEALVREAEAHPDAGAIGSRILFPDGSLQEAGCLIWPDGSTEPLGRGLPAGSLAFRTSGPVDYCSACALLVRRDIWHLVGGFDEEYFPGYYEDVDLCMKIRARGQHVRYTSQAVVRHHESQSSDRRFRDFLNLRHRRRFVERWRAELSRQIPMGRRTPGAPTLAQVRARNVPRRILVIDDRLPNPALGSGFGRMYQALEALSASGAWVSVATTTPPTACIDRIPEMADVITEDVETHLHGPMLYDAVIVSRPHNLERFVRLVEATQPHAALVYDAEALFHVRVLRQARHGVSRAARWRLAREAAALRKIERSVRAKADMIVCVSEEEASWFERTSGDTEIVTMMPIVAGASLTSGGFGSREGAVFVAGWLAGASSPNADGLRWFCDEVAPHVRAAVPTFRLHITGQDPPANVRGLADDATVFTGHVRDLDELYGRARVAIVPERYGSGVKIKALEALQFGVPVVSTSVGAEGLPSSAPVDVADSPRAFADALVRLLTEEDVWAARRRRLEERAGSWAASVRTSWPAAIDAALLRRSPEQIRRRRANGASPPSVTLLE